jgi:hypothetical protein
MKKELPRITSSDYPVERVSRCSQGTLVVCRGPAKQHTFCFNFFDSSKNVLARFGRDFDVSFRDPRAFVPVSSLVRFAPTYSIN